MALLQEDLKAEVLVVEEKKARTFALIESIGQEKGVVDDAVESSRADEEEAAKLQVSDHWSSLFLMLLVLFMFHVGLVCSI